MASDALLWRACPALSRVTVHAGDCPVPASQGKSGARMVKRQNLFPRHDRMTRGAVVSYTPQMRALFGMAGGATCADTAIFSARAVASGAGRL